MGSEPLDVSGNIRRGQKYQSYGHQPDRHMTPPARGIPQLDKRRFAHSGHDQSETSQGDQRIKALVRAFSQSGDEARAGGALAGKEMNAKEKGQTYHQP